MRHFVALDGKMVEVRYVAIVPGAQTSIFDFGGSWLISHKLVHRSRWQSTGGSLLNLIGHIG
jgi:hypothetical protein